MKTSIFVSMISPGTLCQTPAPQFTRSSRALPSAGRSRSRGRLLVTGGTQIRGEVSVYDGVNQLLPRSSRQGVKYYRSSYREEVTVGGLSQVRESGCLVFDVWCLVFSVW